MNPKKTAQVSLFAFTSNSLGFFSYSFKLFKRAKVFSQPLIKTIDSFNISKDKRYGACEARTRDLQIMRLTRCRLR